MLTSIKSVKNIEKSGDSINITGHLKVTSDIKNVKVKWVLPQDIELISGSQNSFLSATEPGQDYQFQITIKSNTDSNQIIHLIANGHAGPNLIEITRNSFRIIVGVKHIPQSTCDGKLSIVAFTSCGGNITT